MWDTRAVELVLQLPTELADSVEAVKEDDPDFLSRVIRYGLARRAVYQNLSSSPPEIGVQAQAAELRTGSA
ncbi:MAG: hypothetical protein ABFS14_10840 [Gemmatimonadota bacterium]